MLRLEIQNDVQLVGFPRSAPNTSRNAYNHHVCTPRPIHDSEVSFLSIFASATHVFSIYCMYCNAQIGVGSFGLGLLRLCRFFVAEKLNFEHE